MISDLLIIIVLILISISVIYSIYLIIKSRRGKPFGIGILIVICLLFIVLKSFLIGVYPDVKSTHRIDENVRVYDPNQSYEIIDINKLVLIDDIGFVFLKQVRAVSGSEIRLIYRTLGIHSVELFDTNIVFYDENGNEYELRRDGGGANSGLITSGACYDFYGENENVLEIGSILINNTVIDM